MPYYRLYCVNGAGHFFKCEEIDVPNDDAAINEAMKRRGAHAAELWNGGRMVKAFQVLASEQ
jgi:hypothetical protein